MRKYSPFRISSRMKSNTFKPSGYWDDEKNVLQFLSEIKQKLNLNSPKDWKILSGKTIQLYGGGTLLKKYSLFDIKCMGCPEGKLIYQKPIKPPGYWENEENIFQFLQEVKEKYNLKTSTDWNSLTNKKISKLGGSSILKKYSIYDLKCMACPEGENDFNLPSKPPGYWENEECVKKFLEKFKEKYNLKQPEDWNSITKAQIKKFGGTTLFNSYSLYQLKCLGCTEGNFTPVHHKSKGFWRNIDNVQQFLIELKEKLNFQNFDDWNSLNKEHILNNGGRGLLSCYSLYQLKCLGFPDGKNKFSKPTKPTGYWHNHENVKSYLKELKENLNLKTPEDWNSITQQQVQLHGGNGLLKKHSIYELKCIGCPEGKSIFNKPNKKIGFWEKQENIQKFLDKVKVELNFHTPEEWNTLNTKQIIALGGSRLLKFYTIFEIKCMACPEGRLLYNQPTIYKSPGFWNSQQNIDNFINHLKTNLKIQSPEDWKRVSKSQICELGGNGLLLKIPHDEFIKKQISNSKTIIQENSKNKGRSSQRWLFLQIQSIFPGEEIVEDYFHSEISRETGFPVQFDIFLVQKNIAIEYHGQQHYEDIPFAFASLELYNNRDNEKKLLCKKYGIDLIIIPYWWDNSIESLQSTIISKLNKETS